MCLPMWPLSAVLRNYNEDPNEPKVSRGIGEWAVRNAAEKWWRYSGKWRKVTIRWLKYDKSRDPYNSHTQSINFRVADKRFQKLLCTPQPATASHG